MYRNLVLGFLLIGTGLVLGFFTLPYIGITISPVIEIIMLLIMTVPFFVVGGLLLRKYDNDRKLEKRTEK
jgi:O-antigen/teichoic acid export membrane protein